MKFSVSATSGMEPPCKKAERVFGEEDFYVEIASLEDLVDLSKSEDCKIIVSGDIRHVEIYDGYRE